MNNSWYHNMVMVLEDVSEERYRQRAKWGEQNHPDGTSCDEDSLYLADKALRECDAAAESGEITYAHILYEEVMEAFAESDQTKLRTELVQVAAVAVAWIEKIDRELANRKWKNK